ncbi:hypothetical protein EYC58_02935 [Candidatus Saccharibacteria bacterium]|nr:MAG: hypothetical protein EYC58_02935 [Candidatus Saccharibacteria bacterium]
MKRKQTLKIVVLVVLVGQLSLVWVQRQAVADWMKLLGYQAPSPVAALATEDTMTPEATKLFYVNHPEIVRGTLFSSNCPAGGEKTVVLGCYKGNDRGIYLYDVTDERLNGVEQVTAAHEMLHAAYRRLSSSERKEVDGWLMAYYQNELTDQRIKDIIESYKKSEPDDVVNEMHSIFATEIATLPSNLETYYKRYFENRAKVIAYTSQYQAEFTTRQDQITTYDSQLKSLKSQIDANEATLKQQRSTLDKLSQQMQSAKARGDTAAYNSMVPGYNAKVNAFNVLLEATKSQIAQYNDLVEKRNAVAVEEQQLVKALSSDTDTVTTQ